MTLYAHLESELGSQKKPSSSLSSRPWYQPGLLVSDLGYVGRPMHQPGKSEKDEFAAWKIWRMGTFCLVWSYTLTYLFLQPVFDCPDRYWGLYLTNWNTVLICIHVTTTLAAYFQQPKWDQQQQERAAAVAVDVEYKHSQHMNDKDKLVNDSPVTVPWLVRFNNIMIHVLFPASLTLACCWLWHVRTVYHGSNKGWFFVRFVLHIVPVFITVPEAFFMAHPFRLNLMWLPFGYISIYLTSALIFELAHGAIHCKGKVVYHVYTFLDWREKPWDTALFYIEALSFTVGGHIVIWLAWREGNRYFAKKGTETDGLSKPLTNGSTKI